jgi:EAL domain-containing protein (putative c-di-GMP-specific phosphodiesterase class I)
MDNFEIINEKLYKLREMGIEVSIDDFGTGYSSLSRESELNVCNLKIDKYFIDKINEQNTDKIIAGDIISMAHKLGHFVVAEGVENKEQYEYLLKNNCDFIQGYYIGKPLNDKDVIKLLNNN